MKTKNSIFGMEIYAISMFKNFYLKNNLNIEGIERNEYVYLTTVAIIPGMNQECITKFISGDKSTSSRTIDKLIKLGYLRKESDPANHRSNIIFLTKKGEFANKKILQVINEFEQKILDGIDANEIKVAKKVINSMCLNKDKIEAKNESNSN